MVAPNRVRGRYEISGHVFVTRAQVVWGENHVEYERERSRKHRGGVLVYETCARTVLQEIKELLSIARS